MVEVGANIGGHTVFLAKYLQPEGKIYAFEPRRQLYQLLCANLAINGLENVYAFPVALSDVAGAFHETALDFSQPLNAGGIAIGSIPGQQEVIDLKTLDAVIPPDQKVSVIKADVEGFELNVINGAQATIARNRPVLYLENDNIERSPALIARLWDLGYDVWWHAVPLFRSDNRASTPHNIFGNTVSLNIMCLPIEMHEPDIMILLGRKVSDPSEHPLAKA